MIWPFGRTYFDFFGRGRGGHAGKKYVRKGGGGVEMRMCAYLGGRGGPIF